MKKQTAREQLEQAFWDAMPKARRYTIDKVRYVSWPYQDMHVMMPVSGFSDADIQKYLALTGTP